MENTASVTCPNCGGSRLLLKYAVTYEYSYALDSNAPGECNTEELLPYLYDNREQKESQQYIECETCGAKYPCYFDHWVKGITPAKLQKALHSANCPDRDR